MELDITHLMAEPARMVCYASSVMELGQNAGKYTWENSLDRVEESPLLTDDQLPEFRDYIRDFGAWDDEEIDSWSPLECNALCLQLIAGDIRERQHYADRDELDEYEQNQGGNIYQDGDCWFYSLSR